MSGYWQLRVAEEYIEKTNFSCHHGLFEFVRMPFGLCNAPATMQGALDILLAQIKWEACLVYLDNIITYGAIFRLMLQWLRMIFMLFRSANLHMKSSKCFFGYDYLAYLGHLVSGNGVEVDPEKIRAKKEIPRPMTKMQLRSFLGLASYYRRFIEGFAQIAGLLHKLTGETVAFVWDERCDGIREIEDAAFGSTGFDNFQPTQTLSLHMDMSGLGLGAVLNQGVKKDKRVLVYSSRCFIVHEQNYGIPELGALAFIWAVKNNRHYLLGRHFRIVTDLHCFCGLKKMCDSKGKLGHWMLEIAKHQYDIVHKSGILHIDVHALSLRMTS